MMRLTKKQSELKDRIEKAYRKSHGFLYVHPTWGTKLWKKSTSDIYEFLEGRFRETLDVVEYYSTLVLLWKTLPNSELLVEFHDSPQWIKAFGMIGTCNHLNQKQTTNKSKQKSVKRGAQPIETVKSVDTIQVIRNE